MGGTSARRRPVAAISFHPNDLKRYSLGTKNKNLYYAADGSLTLTASATAVPCGFRGYPGPGGHHQTSLSILSMTARRLREGGLRPSRLR